MLYCRLIKFISVALKKNKIYFNSFSKKKKKKKKKKKSAKIRNGSRNLFEKKP